MVAGERSKKSEQQFTLGDWVQVKDVQEAQIRPTTKNNIASAGLTDLQGCMRMILECDESVQGLYWLDFNAANQQANVGLKAEQLVLIDSDSSSSAEAEVQMVEHREIQLGANLHGVRLDKALQHLAPEFSRNYLQQLLRKGMVQMEGRSALKPAQKVSVGQNLVLHLLPTPQSQAFQPEQMDLDVLYEDEHLMIINKPAGLVVHPAAGNWSGTLLNGLLAYHLVFSTLPRAGIVHRLDKDTSGLMLVAKSMPAVARLVEQIAKREVSRQYVAVVHLSRKKNPLAHDKDLTVDAAIGRDPSNRLRMAVVDLAYAAGKPARTHFRLIAENERFACVLCRLETGRTHQIRVHLRHLGMPLVGDALYGGEPHVSMSRQALHAWRLELRHPCQTRLLKLQSELPEDFAHLLSDLQIAQEKFLTV